MIHHAKKILPGVLAASLLANFYFLLNSGEERLERDMRCAQFKSQAAERIATYYARSEEGTDLSPRRIFHSNKAGGCVAVWDGITYSASGISTSRWVIFDPITNRTIFSRSADLEADDAMAAAMLDFDKALAEIES